MIKISSDPYIVKFMEIILVKVYSITHHELGSAACMGVFSCL